MLIRNPQEYSIIFKHHHLMFPSLDQLNPFPPQGSVKAIITQLTFLLYFYHQVSCTYTFLDSFYGIRTFLTDYTIEKLIPSEYSLLGYISILFLLLLTMITALYNQDKYSGVRYLLSWIGIRVFPLLRILLQLNTALSAYFTIIDKYCLVLFVITACINLLATFLLQNYSVAKDPLMCGNMGFSLIWRGSLYFNVIASQVVVWVPSEQFYNIVLSLRLLMLFGVWMVYVLSGFLIYQRFICRFWLIAILLIKIGVSSGQWIDQMVFILQLHTSYYDYVYAIAVFIPMTLCTSSYFRYNMCNIYSRSDNSNLKGKIFFFKQRISDYDEDIESQCFVRGLVIDHYLRDCCNPACYSHKQLHYDSKRNKECQINKVGVNKSIYSKLLMKCWYETMLNEKSLDDRIDYIQFLFLRLKNTFKCLQILEQSRSALKFPFHKLRVSRLLKEIQKQNIKLNKDLYNGTLDIEFIISSQKVFDKLKLSISQVLRNNKVFWSTVYNNKVDLTQLVRIVQPNFKIMEGINEEWKLLSCYFDIQRKWKFYYAWYTLYVKNQKLKPLILEQFTTQVREEYIFTDTPTHHQGDYNESEIIFGGLSAAVHVSSSASMSVVKRVSNSFTRLFGYEQSEILESPIEVLMTHSLSKVHHQMLNQWCEEGKSATQFNYHIRKVYIKHKAGTLIGANKYLKQYITPSNELEYIALFKTFDDEENILITDSSLNIEGMTSCLFKSLGLSQMGFSPNYVNNLNLSLLIAKLFPLSDYYSVMSESEREILGTIDQNRKKKTQLKRAQSKGRYPKSQKNFSMLNFSSKEAKQMDISCSFRIPTNFRELVRNSIDGDYPSLDIHQKIKVIKGLMDVLESSQTSASFCCRLIILPKIYNNHKYYQIYFKQLTNQKKTNTIKSMMKKRENTVTSLVASQFHKYFETGQNEKIFSLSHANNIFIKQDNNKPLEKLNHINTLKYFLRPFFFALVIVCFISSYINYSYNFSDYILLAKQLSVTQNTDLYNFSYENDMFALHFYNSQTIPPQFRNTSYFDVFSKRIEEDTAGIIMVQQRSQLVNVVFGSAVNPLRLYGTSYDYLMIDGSSSVRNKYDEVDFMVKIFQMIEQVKFNTFERLSLQDQACKYLMFFMNPAFQDYISTIEGNINSLLQARLDNSMKITIIIYVFLSFLFLMGVVVAVLRIAKIIESFISIIGVFTNFNQQNIQKIYMYSNFIHNFFRYLKRRDLEQRVIEPLKDDASGTLVNPISLTFDAKIYQTDDNNNININKKIKKIQVGSILNIIRLKTYGLIILTFIIFVGGGVFSTTLIRQQNEKIQLLTNSGFQHFQYYSIFTRMQSAVNKKYFNSSLYSQYFQSHYQHEIHTIQYFKNNNQRMMQGSKPLLFIDRYNSVYFENVCQYLILDDVADTKKCETVTAGSLQFGIQSYVYEFTDQALKFLRGNSSIDYAVIFQYEEGLRYVNRFLVQLNDMWAFQYEQTVEQSRDYILVSTVLLGVCLVLVYLVLFELLTIRNLNIEYQTFRNIYDMCMPDYLVTKQKIIKAKLVTDGILDK